MFYNTTNSHFLSSSPFLSYTTKLHNKSNDLSSLREGRGGEETMASHTCSSFLSLNSSSSSQLAKTNPIPHAFLLPPTLIHLSSSRKHRLSMNMHIHKHDSRTTLINNVVRSVLTGNNAAKTASDRVQQVHSTNEFDEALRNAKNRLVVVEYAATRVPDSKALYPFMVSLSKTCADVDFLLVMGDESEKTRALCEREKVFKVPHFTFYKNMEKVHEEDAITAGQLADDVLYYGDRETQVRQLHNRDDVEALIATHKEDDKLIVLDVGLKHCGPCVKVYPTVVKLARQMVDSVVFARMNGDENDSCMDFLKNMDVVQVPTFLFIREGEIKGRYVGSGKGELIGEILRYQGVRVTY